MTKEDIKKALECCSNPNTGSCKDCPYNDNDEFHCAYGEMCKDALNLINEQEKSIQMAQDNILSVAQQNQEYREQQVKQAQIDVLNELKVRHDYANIAMGYPWWDVSQQIDELITEVQND